MKINDIINNTRKVRGENIAQLDKPLDVATTKKLMDAGIDPVPKASSGGVFSYILKPLKK